MKAYYTDIFVLPLPENHRFPMRKYSRLRERLLSENVLSPDDLHIPDPATDTQILRCHDADYLQKVKTGTLSRKEVTRIGFPWSPELVERSRRSVGATICASRTALTDGVSVNLAGGTHHAGRDHGEGYSVFNDAAIAARELQATGIVKQVLVIDCDVHQGNGTAGITHNDPSIFAFSIHGQKNFPFRKVMGDLDIGLPTGTNDSDYLDMLAVALEQIFFIFTPDLVIYIAGADPFEGDKLGKLCLTKDGLAARDELVFTACHSRGVPVAVAMGGGYAPDVDDIVDIHLQTIDIAARYAGKWR